jgi:L-ascorbate metabolism protein UlaG (beta-lactamase superfamily)
MNLPLKVKADLLPKIKGFAVDCRMLFMGDRVRQLVRTYEEIVHRFKRIGDAERLFENLQGSDEIKQFYEIQKSDGVTSVTLRPFAFQERASLEDLEIDVRFQLNRSVFSYPLPLEKIAALGNLLPLLRANLTETRIQDSLSRRLSREEAEWAMNVLSLLIQKDFVTDSPLPRNHFEIDRAGSRVTFMGHSSVFFQSKRGAVLADPCLRLEYQLPEYAMDAARLKLSAIVCSHSHWDHCDLQSFLWFDKETELIIPRVKQATVFNPPVVEAMRSFGFKNIREVDLWQPVQIEDIELIPVPFHGEQDEPDAAIDHFTYVLRTEDLSVYAGVDSYKDTFGDMIPVLERVREEYHPVLAFLPVSKMTYRYEWGGVNGFCRYLDTTLLDKSFQYTASAEDAAEWVRALKPQWVSPYATFNFAPWSTPAEVPQFAKALRRADLEDHLYPIRPFEYLEACDFSPALARELRRRTLVRWFQFGAAIRKYDKRMQENRIYRYLRNRRKRAEVR